MFFPSRVVVLGDRRKVEEHDYDAILPALAALVRPAGWTDAAGGEVARLVPWVCNALHFLYDDDGVLGR